MLLANSIIPFPTQTSSRALTLQAAAAKEKKSKRKEERRAPKRALEKKKERSDQDGRLLLVVEVDVTLCTYVIYRIYPIMSSILLAFLSYVIKIAC